MNTLKQSELDKLNAEFWDEPCGWQLWKGDFASFDARYFQMYPFLTRYLDKLRGTVLEAGVGYGTVAAYIARTCDYRGLDIAPGPVGVLTRRGLLGRVGSVLDIPYADESFDCVVSIGCLHHAGDIRRGLDELHRVCRHRGLFMLYNAAYGKSIDVDRQGNDCPHVEYTRLEDIPALMAGWDVHTVSIENKSQDIYIEAFK